METALDIWPALPIRVVIDAKFQDDADGNIIDALEARDRIVEIRLWGLTQSKLKKCLGMMQQLFPVLTSLTLITEHGEVTCAHVNTDTFLGGLGGSILRLKRLFLDGIQFSALSTLLSSASELVDLNLVNFPVTGRGHISPEAMTICLSSLTRLRSLSIHFGRRPDFTYPQHPPPSSLAPTVLPTLADLSLGGPHEYLEDLLTRIDTPLLEQGQLSFHNVPNFDHPQISQFIHRTGMFNFPSKLEVYIRKGVSVKLSSSIGPEKGFDLGFTGSDLSLYTEVELTEHFCTRYPPLLSHIQHLQLGGDEVEYRHYPLNAPWLELLQPFTAVKTLHLSGTFIMPRVSLTLGVLEEEEATEVLPALRTLVLEWAGKEVSEAAGLVKPFIVARKHSERPVVLKRDSWDGDSDSSDTE
jgi:hypothetical protein